MRVPQHFLGRPCVSLVLATFAVAAYLAAPIESASAQRPTTDRHVSELARYFNGVKIAAPIIEQGLAVYPVLVEDVPLLKGNWQTLDEAIDHGTLVIREKGGGSVPTVSVENRSRETYILLMTGDVIKGGMQTRTVRHDTVLGPRQRIDLDVFCVEAQRWEGVRDLLGRQDASPAVDQGRDPWRRFAIRSVVAGRGKQPLAGDRERHSQPGIGRASACGEEQARCRAKADRARSPPRHGRFHLHQH